MAKLWSLFSVVLTIWFLVLDQQIIIQTTSFLIISPNENTNNDSLVVNETTLSENSTEVLSEIEKLDASVDDDDDDDDDDVIELNVSGQKISTFRSTLTVVPNSKLALMFTKDNTGIGPPRDKQGAVVFDYNPVQFNYLLDQLRMIKRSPEISVYELELRAPRAVIHTNFSYMISDLGLNPEQFLAPFAGVHLNLSINSLVGWQECHRSTYDTPFNLSTLAKSCESRKLLVGCHNSAQNRDELALAGVGKWEDIFQECSSINNCPTDLNSGTSFYYVTGQAWGFVGRPKDSTTNYNNHHYHSTSLANPCDAGDQFSQYRLCWSLRSSFSRGGGDRCGTMKNLHNAVDWERVIYKAI